MPTNEEVQALKDIINELKAELDRLSKSPLTYATVVAVQEKFLTLSHDGSLIRVEKPKFRVLSGQQVLLYPATGQVFEPATLIPVGSRASVSKIVDDERVEVEGEGGGTQIVLRGQESLKAGDQVLVSGGAVVVAKLPESKATTDYGDTGTGVTWDDIAGQEDGKAALREAVELPLKFPEVFKHYNKKPAKGVLLSGPPGCGKTMLGKAVATAISGQGVSSVGFMYVKGPELLNMWVGETESNIRKLFARAKAFKAEFGRPAVLFIDEADAVLGVRGAHHSHMEKTVVPMFLTEMDGLEENAALVILATNRPDQLDPAVTREGRIDRKVNVARPDVEDVFSLFQLYLSKVPRCDSEDVRETAAYATQSVFDEAKALYEVHTDRGAVPFLFHHLVSGALVAGIVERATSLALQRDIAAGAPSGVKREDVITAVSRVFEDNRNTNHDDAIRDFAGARKVHEVRRLAAH